MGTCEVVSEVLGQNAGIQIAHLREYEAAPARFVNSGSLKLEARLQRYLQSAIPDGLYTHQEEAIQHVLNGEHTVVSTKTSSGKSLIFAVPALQSHLTAQSATSLFIYPQKALANDQLVRLRSMYSTIYGVDADRHLISRYDGATDEAERPGIRKHGQFILTNPDMLHLGMLRFHSKWQRFFANLKYVIIDEAHSYRGVFGSNVAYILRRLRCVCKRYGSSPVFVSTSATIDNPTEHLGKLTGLPFREVGPESDGSPQGARKIWLIRGSHQHHYQVGRNLTKTFVENDLGCLTFCPSRVTAERLVSDLGDNDTRDERICVYRAGLTAQERERIEDQMRTGATKGVFSTSALELGIDIGLLDVVVCVGLPNTIMSLWQRAGRVGRAGREAAVVFVSADTPLDTYFSEHPLELLNRQFEPLVLTLQNRRVICNHLACAIQENGDDDAVDVGILGPDIAHALELRRNARLNDEVFYSDDPHTRTPVRNNDASNYALLADGLRIGEIDPWHMIREAHPNAIYLHGGRAYRVRDVRTTAKEIRLSREYTRNVTLPVIHSTVRLSQLRSMTTYSGLRVKLADIEVTTRLVGFQEKNRAGETVRQHTGSQGLNAHRLPTEGVCVEVQPDVVKRIDGLVRHGTRHGVVHAIERLLGGLFPVISGPCDVMDFDTFSDSRTDSISWWLYDQVRDGIGLTTQAYRLVPDLFQKAAEQIRLCKCTDTEGCFCCIKNPEQVEVVTKDDCIATLELIGETLASSTPTEQEFEVERLQDDITSSVCPECSGPINVGSNFCPNCGHRVGG